jgi:ribosomal protein S18 acetylase RimI-like enzyme
MMISTSYRIQTVSPSDERRAVDLIVRAFRSDPPSRWIYPDLDQYDAVFPRFVRAFGGTAFEYGTVYSVDDFRGAALWLPPGAHPDEEALSSLLEQTVPERFQDDAFSLFEQMSLFHPGEPHWYLPLIGIDPAYHRQGYGAALLRHTLAECDRDRLPAYLEASSLESIPLYERHGFRALSTIQVGSSPPITPMLRRPRGIGG